MPQHTVNQHMKALEEQRDALMAQHTALRNTQHVRLLELHAGTKLCEGLAFLQARVLHHQQGSGSIASDERAALLSQLAADMFGQQESAMMDQLAQLPDSNNSSGNGNSNGSAGAPTTRSLEQLLEEELQLGDPGVQTVSPPHNPLAYMRDLFNAPVQPGAASITAEQLAGLHRDAVTVASVLLHGLEFEPDAGRRQEALQQLRQHWDRYFAACANNFIFDTRFDGQLLAFHRSLMIDQSTMKPDAERACQRAHASGRLMQQLGLTQQQRDLMAAGVRLCMRQVEHLTAQQAQLQAADFTAGSATSALEGMSDRSPAAARHALLAAEQQRLSKLNRLLLKEIWMRMLGGTWVLGCLTWAQVTRMATASWPFCVRWLLAASDAMTDSPGAADS